MSVASCAPARSCSSAAVMAIGQHAQPFRTHAELADVPVRGCIRANDEPAVRGHEFMKSRCNRLAERSLEPVSAPDELGHRARARRVVDRRRAAVLQNAPLVHYVPHLEDGPRHRLQVL